MRPLSALGMKELSNCDNYLGSLDKEPFYPYCGGWSCRPPSLPVCSKSKMKLDLENLPTVVKPHLALYR